MGSAAIKLYVGGFSILSGHPAACAEALAVRACADGVQHPAAPVSAAKARAALTELGRSARRAGGEGLLWPKRPVISSEQCEDGTQPGTMFLLRARFTTRDMDDVHGPSEVLQVSQASRRVAARVVDAWLAGELLAGIEPLHGEWDFTMPAGVRCTRLMWASPMRSVSSVCSASAPFCP